MRPLPTMTPAPLVDHDRDTFDRIPPAYRQNLTFIETAARGVENSPTGKGRGSSGGVPFETATLNENGIANFKVKNLSVGTDAITAESLGDGLSAKSTSTVLNQVVAPGSQ